MKLYKVVRDNTNTQITHYYDLFQLEIFGWCDAVKFGVPLFYEAASRYPVPIQDDITGGFDILGEVLWY
jgi:hypothetical protein